MLERDCNCLALRQAARHVTAFYDRALAETGLRATQFSLLAKLERHGALPMTSLAELLVMDRTTLNRNLVPLVRERLIGIVPGDRDRRRREIRLTPRGRAKLAAAERRWAGAQLEFERAFGHGRCAELRALLREVAASPLP